MGVPARRGTHHQHDAESRTPMSRRRSIREQKGQTMVEFALVMPVLFLVLFGIIQFGALYNDYITRHGRSSDRRSQGSREPADGNPAGHHRDRDAASEPRRPDEAGCRGDRDRLGPGADVTVQTSYPYSINILGMVVASGNLKSSRPLNGSNNVFAARPGRQLSSASSSWPRCSARWPGARRRLVVPRSARDAVGRGRSCACRRAGAAGEHRDRECACDAVPDGERRRCRRGHVRVRDASRTTRSGSE